MEIRDDKLVESAVIRFSFEQWLHWLDEIVNDELTNTNGAVIVTTQDNTWLVRQTATGATLAFTEQEWISFRLGVIDGEFTPSIVTKFAVN